MIVRKALAFARQRHQGQIRKGDGRPFIVHPIAVSKILKRYGMPDPVAAAGALHDVLEDTPTTAGELTRLFGPRVSGWVREVTEPSKRHPWEFRKAGYLRQMRRASREALAIACADKLHNARSLLSAYRREGGVVFDRFSRGIDRKLEYQRQVTQIVRRRWPDCPLLPELEQVFLQLEEIGRRHLKEQSGEMEAKFIVEKEAVLNRIARLRVLGPFRRERSFQEEQWNQYWDTADFRLKLAHAALKVRRVGRRSEITFKRQTGYRGGVSDRIELTVRLPPGPAAARKAITRELPIEPVRQARKIVGARPLEEVLTMRTQRRRRVFVFGKETVELDLDRVRILKGRRQIGTHREVELENLSAEEGRFRRVLAAFRRQFRGQARISRISKYETGLRLLQWEQNRTSGVSSRRTKGDPK